MNKAEAQDLAKKAKKACMDEARLMRMLLAGYNPPEAPDERFYEDMAELRQASDVLADAVKLFDGEEDRQKLQKAAGRLLKLQLELEKKYLAPKESDLKWQ